MWMSLYLTPLTQKAVEILHHFRQIYPNYCGLHPNVIILCTEISLFLKLNHRSYADLIVHEGLQALDQLVLVPLIHVVLPGKRAETQGIINHLIMSKNSSCQLLSDATRNQIGKRTSDDKSIQGKIFDKDLIHFFCYKVYIYTYIYTHKYKYAINRQRHRQTDR